MRTHSFSLLSAASVALFSTVVFGYTQCDGGDGNVHRYPSCGDGYTCTVVTQDLAQCVPIGDSHTSGKRSNTGGRAGAAFTPVVGPPGVELRLPIDELQSKHPDVFNIFILALEAFQAADESLDVSYYQVSGIHGRPFIPWQSPATSSQDTSVGYCTHNSVLFATWHRPYLSLLEQTLYAHAVSVAQKFKGPNGLKYQLAARKVRLPYWDWSSAATKSHIPAVVMQERITVTKPGPSGKETKTTIPNPLFSYKFTNAAYRTKYFDGNWVNLDHTVRQPDDRFNSQNARADEEMANDYDSRRENTFNLFTIPNFNGFSSTAYTLNSTPQAWTSVEMIHNIIHMNVGGDGHIGSVPYSAFDPIFWLHHCNVDRLTAIYQAIKPNLRVTPGPATGTFERKITRGDVDTVDTPLWPFRHPNGALWTSEDVSSASSIYKYGYSYPEVPAEFQNKPADQLIAFASKQVNKLYGPDLGGDSAGSPPQDNLSRQEWVAHAVVDQSQIEGGFQTLVFLGDVPQNVNEWLTAPNLVGTVAALDAPMKENQGESLIKGTIPLTKALVGKNINLDAESVVPFLKDNLHWVVQQKDQKVSLDTLSSLKLGVSSSTVEYTKKDTELPTWKDPITHYEVTDGKKGGLKPQESNLVESQPAKPVLNSTIGGNITARAWY